jgi:hypothetical protein
MIPPRRAASTGDLDLLPAMLGAVAVARELVALIAELAEDGDRASEPVAISGDVLDALLGVASLARRVLSRSSTAATSEPEPEPEHAEPVVLAELLR